MKLLITRNQDQGFLGGTSFILEARVELTAEEKALVEKYKAHKEVLFSSGNREYTISSLTSGVKDKCKDVTILLNNEEVYKNACTHLKTLLDVMKSFGGQEEFQF